jgi:DNA polymerase III epsilon subunit-like protein
MWDFTVFIILVVICYLVYRWVKRNRREEKNYRNHVPETFVVVDVETTGLDPAVTKL